MAMPLLRLLPVLVLFPLGARAEDRAVSLGEVIDEVLRHAPRVVEADAEVQAAEGALAQAQALFPENPELEARYASDFAFAREGDREVEVNLSQELEIAGQRGLRRQAAEERLRAARHRLTLARAEARAEATVLYARLWAAGRKLALAQRVEAIARTAGAAAKRRFEQGDISEVEAALFAADAARISTQAQEAAAELEAARAELALLTAGSLPGARAASALPSPEPRAIQLPSPESTAAVQEPARAAAAAEAELSLARRERIPNPTVSLGYEREDGQLHLGELHVDESTQRLALSLSLPLPLWNRNAREIAEASARRRIAEEKARAAAASSSERLQRAASRARLAWESERTLSEVLPSAERARDILERGFERGQLGLTDYIGKRDLLLQAELSALSAHVARVEAFAELDKLRAAAPLGDK